MLKQTENRFPGTEGTHYAGVAIPETETEVEIIDCPDCEGKGSVVDDWPRRANKPGEEQTYNCPACNGTGEVSKEVMTCCGLTDYDCRCVSLG